MLDLSMNPGIGIKSILKLLTRMAISTLEQVFVDRATKAFKISFI